MRSLFLLAVTALSLTACHPANGPLATPAAAPHVVADPSTEARPPTLRWPARTHYHHVEVHGRRIFYREAGSPDRPTLLLLHGYPSSSHTYRALIPLLSGHYHVIAPDNLGSGYSDHPDPEIHRYTFESLATHIEGLTEALQLERYVLYLQDFGGPVGMRMMMRHPERVTALIVQNANAYLDGLTAPRRVFFQSAHDDRSPEKTQALAQWVSDEAIRNTQYLRDVPGDRAQYMSPDAWTHDIAMLHTDAERAAQVQLFQDYQNNIDAYPTWQAMLRATQPPALILWGERDPAFVADGARAYLRDLPDATLHLLDAGHFAAEERPVEIAQAILRFLDAHLPQ